MLEAVKFLRTIADQPAMRELIETEVLPGPSIRSDEELVDDFRSAPAPSIIPSRPAAWDPTPPAPWSIRACRVHGLEGLSVIDASIFPEIISGNTNAPTIMTGWKGAEMVMEDQK